MISDDTEHTCFVARALLRSGGHLDTFEKNRAWSFRWRYWAFSQELGLPHSEHASGSD